MYVSVRPKGNGKVHSKSSLISFHGAIQCHVNDLNRGINILSGTAFTKANLVLSAFMKQMTKDRQSQEVQHKETICHQDQAKLNSYFVAGFETNPIALVEMVWYSITKHFCLRGRESKCNLSLEDFEIATNPNYGECIPRTHRKPIKAPLAPMTPCPMADLLICYT